jgi:hypothetical protein
MQSRPIVFYARLVELLNLPAKKSKLQKAILVSSGPISTSFRNRFAVTSAPQTKSFELTRCVNTPADDLVSFIDHRKIPLVIRMMKE